jgi:hypothetical protein
VASAASHWAIARLPCYAAIILLLEVMFEERYAAEWWDGFAKMERPEFEKIAQDLVGPQRRLAILRTIVAEAGAP